MNLESWSDHSNYQYHNPDYNYPKTLDKSSNYGFNLKVPTTSWEKYDLGNSYYLQSIKFSST